MLHILRIILQLMMDSDAGSMIEQRDMHTHTQCSRSRRQFFKLEQ